MGNPTKPILYRTGVTAADVLAATGTVTCTKVAGGSMDAGTHFIAVVAGNTYGRSTKKAGNTSVATETTNLNVKAAFAAVVGATFYDIYGSTDADPKWVGRITEAQRASGILIDAVGTTAAGGAVNSVYVGEVGTGLASATTAAVSTAYVIPTLTAPLAGGYVCRGYDRVYFDCLFSRTGDAVAPVCVVTPFIQDLLDSAWYAVTPVDLDFGGTTAKYKPLRQRVEVDTRGARAVHLLVQQIAGTGASLEMRASKAA